MSSKTLLECRNLGFSYSKQQAPVFKNLSFVLKEGEAALLTGPSGCGKSTLAYCLAGLYPEYAGELKGEILLEGQALSSLSPDRRARKVGILFQNPDDQFCMDRVESEIFFVLENINYSGDYNERMRRLLSLVGLEGKEKAPLQSLSGGMKQKVALACALACEPRLLILDEPLANVDPASCEALSARLRDLSRREGFGLLVVDHRLDYFLPLSTRVIVMDKEGRLLEDAIPPADLEQNQALFDRLGLFTRGAPYPSPRPPLPPQGDFAIRARNLRVAHGKQVVIPSLTLDIPSKRLTAIIGENGGGKTTLFWALAGLLKYKGELKVCGRVGVVFQNPGFQFLTQKVEEEILFTLQNGSPGLPREELLQAAHRLLEEFGLLQYADFSPYMLSQGQQRRLAVLSMLAGDGDILLLDEPTYAQDLRSTRFIMELLCKRVSNGLSAVITTHDIQLAESYADTILCLEKGKLRPYLPGRSKEEPL